MSLKNKNKTELPSFDLEQISDPEVLEDGRLRSKMWTVVIDPGIKNLAHLAWDPTKGEREPIKRWEVESIYKGAASKLKTQELIDLAFSWCSWNFELWEKTDRVFIEIQMSSKMKAVATTIYVYLRSRWPGISVHFLSPLAVKNKYRLGTGTHGGNKKAAVDKMIERMDPNDYRKFLRMAPKKDDLADCWWMMCYADQYLGEPINVG